MKKYVYLAVLLVLTVVGMGAQDRGLSVIVSDELESSVGKQWAVFIAIDRYKEWSPLANPVRDAREIRDILTEYYYIDEVVELYNTDATAAGIRQLLIGLRTQIARDDSVFVFYAGHGQTDPYTDTGFWIPSDGGHDMMAQANWLPNIQVRNMLSQLPAKHVFLISDSCFSGDILDVTRGAGPVINSDYFRRAYSRVSRQVMTSGASESVPDASEFAMRLKSSLRWANGSFVDPFYLFTNVREVRTTQPMLGSIRGSEHQEGGSFLFFRKNPSAPIAGIPAAAPEWQVTSPSLQNPILSPDTPSRQTPEKPNKTQLWSVGASLGTSFAAPWFIGTVRGTVAPLRNSFLEIGFDAGVASGVANVRFYSLFPYVHYAFFMPFSLPVGRQVIDVGWYIGAGGGYMIAEYTFPEGNVPVSAFAINAITGFNIASVLDISYTMRTDFASAGGKLSVGYTYRF